MIAAFLENTLLWRSERSWFAVNERSAPESNEMDALILVTRCFKIDKSSVEDWKQVVNEALHLVVKGRIVNGVNVFNVALYSKASDV